MRLAPVGTGDSANDCEAEAAASPFWAGTAEALECVGEELSWKALASVKHVELQRVADHAGPQLDLPASVAQRVVNQVADRLVEPQPVGLQRQRSIQVFCAGVFAASDYSSRSGSYRL